MKVFKISTTAWSEEDFIIVTDISLLDIINVIKPIVELERNDGWNYDNSDLVSALKEKFPTNNVDFITIDNIEI
jgi:hypothetical protein